MFRFSCNVRRHSSRRSSGAIVCLLAFAQVALFGRACRGNDAADFYSAEAAAIAAAVERVAESVVQIELVGVAEVEAGEVAADAPSAGTIIDSEGLILASSMVTARPAASILVVLSDGSRLPAEVVAKDEGRELVLLRVEPSEPLSAVTLAPVEDVRVGQYAIAVGRVRAEGPPARSVGIVSALGRLHGRALQTDARVSPPFYGGPLLNIRGEILGIVVPAMPEMGEGGDKAGWYDAGIGFVAPADQIAERLEKMKQGASIRPGQLGIVAGSGDPFAPGTRVAAVRAGSPAAEVDIRPGDEIIEIAGLPVRRHAEIRQRLGPLDAETPVSIVLRRDGERLRVTPTLVGEIPRFDPQTIGLLAADREGVRVTAVFPGSPAEKSGFEVGDQIVSIAEIEVESVEQLRKRVLTLRRDQPITVTVSRDGAAQAIEVTPQRITGSLPDQLPPLPGAPIEGEWKVTELTLPDVPNKVAMLAPADVPEETPLGLLIVFAEPGVDNAMQLSDQLTDKWMAAAREHRVVVGIIGSADPARWTPEEGELGGRLAASIRQRHPGILTEAIAATGEGAGAAMAIIAAWTEATPFVGAAVPTDVRPPAIRITENDPSAPIQVLIRGGELPGWSEVLERAGYAMVRGGEDAEAVTRWVWTLARI
ncbi:S1C family serine protease [Candidatus Laterigemmans baculatus]|uniref:S1C family serine protease n=1 Tax=Candidatus Laterigemmans baculatus TaxID=2770505 RepID=UPI0013DBF02E|nr:PDZ domain-containing protein [Candidatus Laterigemmans baculatus]